MVQFQQAKKYLLLTLSLLLATTSYSQAATMTTKSEESPTQESTSSLLESYQKKWFRIAVSMDGVASALIVVFGLWVYFSKKESDRNFVKHLVTPMGVCFVVFPSIIIPIVRLFILLFFKGKDNSIQVYRKNICRPAFYTDLSVCAASVLFAFLARFFFFDEKKFVPSGVSGGYTTYEDQSSYTLIGKILLCFAGFIFPIASMVIRGVLYSGKFPSSRTLLANLQSHTAFKK